MLFVRIVIPLAFEQIGRWQRTWDTIVAVAQRSPAARRGCMPSRSVYVCQERQSLGLLRVNRRIAMFASNPQ